MKTRELRIGDLIFSIFKYAILIFTTFVCLVPVVVCVFTAFKSTDEYNSTSVLDLPSSFTYFDNFVEAFTRANMLQGFINTGICLLYTSDAADE